MCLEFVQLAQEVGGAIFVDFLLQEIPTEMSYLR